MAGRLHGVEHLSGVLDGDPVYWVEPGPWHEHLGRLVQLGFSDTAAHPYEHLVAGTMGVLAAVPGVRAVWQEDREVLLVAAPGVPVETLTEVVDRYWLHLLPRTSVAAAYADDGEVVLHLPPGAADVPLPPSAPVPPDPGGDITAGPPPRLDLAELREAVRLPPSRRRFWTYLVCGVVPLVLGLALATDPGGSNGALLLGVGALNTGIALRIGRRRRALAAGGPTPA